MWLPWWGRGYEEGRNAWVWGPQCIHVVPLWRVCSPHCTPEGSLYPTPGESKVPGGHCSQCMWYPKCAIFFLNRLERFLYIVKWGKEDGIPTSQDKLRCHIYLSHIQLSVPSRLLWGLFHIKTWFCQCHLSSSSTPPSPCADFTNT